MTGLVNDCTMKQGKQGQLMAIKEFPAPTIYLQINCLYFLWNFYV